jgi:hypothetical protein
MMISSESTGTIQNSHNHDAMKWHVRSHKESGVKLTPMCEIVNRLTTLHHRIMDCVSHVFYQVTGLTTELANVVIFLDFFLVIFFINVF